MKYLIVLGLMGAFGFWFFGDKSELGDKPEKEFDEDPIRPPAPHEIVRNPDGTYTVQIDPSL